MAENINIPAAPPPPDQMEPVGPVGDSAAMESPEGKVLLTVLSNSDGTFTLERGEKPDPAMGGDAAMAGQTFDNPGDLLKGILGVIEEAVSAGNGEGSPDENFDAGFKGGSEASPMKPGAPQTVAEKY